MSSQQPIVEENSNEYRILMLGIDGAGKTTILYKLKLGEIVNCIPTIGFNVETLEYNEAKLTIWDVGGQANIRALWKHYYDNTNGLIFVIDSTNTEKFEASKEALHQVIYDPQLQSTSILILVNKIDIGMPFEAIADRLDLHLIKQNWNIIGSCALSGDGLYKGLDFLLSGMKIGGKYKDKS